VKRAIWFVTILLGGLLCFSGAGCNKKQTAPKTPEDAILEVRQAMTTAPKPLQDIFYNTVEPGIRYGKTDEAIAGMEKIASDPSLNEQQKKAVNDMIGLLKAKAPSP
jgi:hypothetical protein